MEDFYYWYCCPRCSKKLLKIYKNTTINNLKIKCRHCKSLIMVNTNFNDVCIKKAE